MTSEAKRLLEQALSLSSPEFMAEVKAAVLASPLVKAKDEEVARLRAEVERLTRERDEGGHAECPHKKARVAAEARERVLREAVEGLLEREGEHLYLTCEPGGSINADRHCQWCVARAALSGEGESRG